MSGQKTETTYRAIMGKLFDGIKNAFIEDGCNEETFNEFKLVRK